MIEQVKEVVELQIGRRKIGRVSSDVTGWRETGERATLTSPTRHHTHMQHTSNTTHFHSSAPTE